MGLGDVVRGIREIREERSGIIPLLMNHLNTQRIKKAIGPTDWLGVSKMGTLCPRALVIAHRLQLPLVDERNPTSNWRMDRGIALHLVFQELWLGPMGFLLGGWKCSRPSCGFVHGASDEEGTVQFRSAVCMPKVCERCGLENGKWTRFHFIEPQMRIGAPYYVQGQSDGLLHLAPNPIEVLDLKFSENLDKDYMPRDGGKYRPSLRAEPKRDHVIQLHWYMDYAGLRQGRLFYVNPAASELHDALAEHVIPFDPNLMFREKEKVRGLREALQDEDRPVPPCPYDGAGPYGDCECVEVAVLWARRGPRPVAP